MRTKISAIVLILSCSLVLLADTGKRPAVVSAKAPEGIEIAAGEAKAVIVTASVQKGFHIQANPPSEPYLIPTRLEMQPQEGISADAFVYPKGKPYELKGNPKPLSVYDGSFELGLNLHVDPEATAGEHRVQAKLRFQACDDTSCLPPASITFDIPVYILRK